MIVDQSMLNDIRARRLRQLLGLLIFVLTFEGVARKAGPPYLAVPLFFFKDIITCVIALYVVRMPRHPALSFLWNAYIILLILFVPLIIFTAADDPILAVFGAKEYLLFPFIGFGTFLAFQNQDKKQIFDFFRWIALLVIPTSVLALVQLHLPHDHWLNMSVGGESLEGFSANGQLRLSSTFSFIAQYCSFLNAEIFIVIIALAGWRESSFVWKGLLLAMIPSLVVGCFLTGSRGAVAGDTAIILFALVFSVLRLQFRPVLQIGGLILVLYLAAIGLNHFFPNTTYVYTQREEGRLTGISADIQLRVYSSFFGIGRDKSLGTIFGNGLGIMSNGSGAFSHYAAAWRINQWTETDFSSVLFEGGYYLAVVWFSFRFLIILATGYRVFKEVKGDLFVPAAVTQGFVCTIGIVGTLGTQPPIAIWWWFGVGSSLLLWWKCVVGTPLEPLPTFRPLPPASQPVPKAPRGRSLYAEALHSQSRK